MDIPAERPAPTYPPRRILAPTDFSELADRSLRYAFDLANHTGATVVAVHATFQMPELSYPAPELTAHQISLWGDAVERVNQTAREKLVAAVEPYRAGVVTETALVSGDPARAIAEAVEEHGCDLVVIGSHGRSGFGRFVLGSVAEQVARRAPCPVLIVR